MTLGLDLPFGLTEGQGLFLVAALFAAAFVRGYSGFGFSAIFIIIAALTTNPLPLIPVVFMCEIAMTLFQARDIGPHIDWRRSFALLAGAAVATVPAVAVMARLDADTARLMISGLVLGLSLVLLSGWQLKTAIGTRGNLGAGMVAGMANSAGVGGLPTAAFLTAQPMPAAVFWATMIVFLTGIDLMALPIMAANGLVGDDTVTGALLAFPILGAGVWLGSRQFSRADQAGFRKAIIGLLAALAALNIARVI